MWRQNYHHHKCNAVIWILETSVAVLVTLWSLSGKPSILDRAKLAVFPFSSFTTSISLLVKKANKSICQTIPLGLEYEHH